MILPQPRPGDVFLCYLQERGHYELTVLRIAGDYVLLDNKVGWKPSQWLRNFGQEYLGRKNWLALWLHRLRDRRLHRPRKKRLFLK